VRRRLASEVGLDGCRDVGEDVSGLLPAGLDRRQHRLDTVAARVPRTAKTVNRPATNVHSCGFLSAPNGN
jgi:hypothetical protein